MIECNNASFRYQNTDADALKKMNLQIQPGECVVLCGKSGCGKTTFSRLLNGLIPSFFHGELMGECHVQDIEAIGGGTLNLVLRSEAVEAAGIVERECGTPWYYGAPYGYTGTLKWLEDIAKIIGAEINPAPVKRLQDKTLRLTPMGGPMGMGMMGRTKPRASIQGDYDTLLGFRQAMLEMDFQVENLICSHSLKAVENPDPKVQFLSKEKDRINLFKNLKGQWCLGSDEMGMFCRETNYFTLISAPFNSKFQRATHLPFMGEKGMDYLVELKNEFFDRFNY